MIKKYISDINIYDKQKCITIRTIDNDFIDFDNTTKTIISITIKNNKERNLDMIKD